MGQVRSGKLINLTWNFFSGQVRSGYIRLSVWPDLTWNLKNFRTIFIKVLKKNGTNLFFFNIILWKKTFLQRFLLKYWKKILQNVFFNITLWKKCFRNVIIEISKKNVTKHFFNIMKKMFSQRFFSKYCDSTFLY